jgi:hypothetical protein
MNRIYRKGGVEVRWVGGGLTIEARGAVLLLDCPTGVVEALGPRIAALRAVALSSGRSESLGGLISLLCALNQARRTAPLQVHVLSSEERAPLLISAWSQGWGGSFPVELDAQVAGSRIDADPFELTSLPVRHGEPEWVGDIVASLPGVGWLVEVFGIRVAYVVGAGPNRAVEKLCREAHLAVLEVGVKPWPESEVRWRLSVAEAIEAAAGAGELWLVGDDGRRVEASAEA